MDSESILFTIKRMLGLEPDYDPFDLELTVDINAAFTMLKQLGIGPVQGFSITGPDELWSDFLTDKVLLNWAKHYIYLKTRLMFDTGLQSSVSKAIDEAAKDLEWRLVVEAEGGEDDERD